MLLLMVLQRHDSCLRQSCSSCWLLMGEPVAQAASIIVQAAYTRNIYDGGKPASIEDFQAELPGVSYEQYAHITSVVRLRRAAHLFACRLFEDLAS